MKKSGKSRGSVCRPTGDIPVGTTGNEVPRVLPASPGRIPAKQRAFVEGRKFTDEFFGNFF